jgi:taurine--2-oxoglutarate transaminase
MYRSYHGSSFGAGELTGEPRRFTVEPGVPGFYQFDGPYPYRAPAQVSFKDEADVTSYYLDRLEERIVGEGADQIAGIVIETVIGSNGVLVPPTGYLPGVKALCEKYGILLILDEVMAGFYRTGTKFAFQQFDVVPDLITFAKGSTCGYVPLGGVILSKKIAEFFNERKMWNGLTYSAHPMGCAVCVAAIAEYERLNIAENVAKVGAVLAEVLNDLTARYTCIGQARYIGLFAQVEFVKDRQTKEPFSASDINNLIGLLKNKGFATYSNENGIMIAPPLIITEQELRDGLAIFEEVLKEISA